MASSRDSRMGGWKDPPWPELNPFRPALTMYWVLLCAMVVLRSQCLRGTPTTGRESRFGITYKYVMSCFCFLLTHHTCTYLYNALPHFCASEATTTVIVLGWADSELYVSMNTCVRFYSFEVCLWGGFLRVECYRTTVDFVLLGSAYILFHTAKNRHTYLCRLNHCLVH